MAPSIYRSKLASVEIACLGTLISTLLTEDDRSAAIAASERARQLITAAVALGPPAVYDAQHGSAIGWR
jgi:hypothetical protein